MDVQDAFRTLVRTEGSRLYRDFPWRQTCDPYAIWISEVMLQQTQVSRVEARWDAWMERFPDVRSLSDAPAADVLEQWQGMGYNRRALNLGAAAREIVRTYGGEFPRSAAALEALPGVGPATAQGIRSFAFDLPGIYLETNVRAVFLHHLFPGVEGVTDRELAPLVEAACPAGACVCGGGDEAVEASDHGRYGPYADPQDEGDTPRNWYYALLDYGAQLKRTVGNPSRRSRGYARQSAFEGSRRQKRAEVVRILLAEHESDTGSSLDEVTATLNRLEREAGRDAVDAETVASILGDLAREGFCCEDGGRWRIR